MGDPEFLLLHVGSFFSFSFLFQLWHAGSLAVLCEILFPNQGSSLGPLRWEHEVLATELPGESLLALLKKDFSPPYLTVPFLAGLPQFL